MVTRTGMPALTARALRGQGADHHDHEWAVKEDFLEEARKSVALSMVEGRGLAGSGEKHGQRYQVGSAWSSGDEGGSGGCAAHFLEKGTSQACPYCLLYCREPHSTSGLALWCSLPEQERPESGSDPL